MHAGWGNQVSLLRTGGKISVICKIKIQEFMAS